MTPEEITQLMRQTLLTTLELAAPFLLLVLIVGILISLFQAMTQLHEMTLSFVPKMLVLTIALVIFFPWMLKILTKFTTDVLVHQWEKVVNFTHYTL